MRVWVFKDTLRRKIYIVRRNVSRAFYTFPRARLLTIGRISCLIRLYCALA
jgi:hypothetical protein